MAVVSGTPANQRNGATAAPFRPHRRKRAVSARFGLVRNAHGRNTRDAIPCAIARAESGGTPRPFIRRVPIVADAPKSADAARMAV